jgi:hypothetical protein
MELGIVEKDCIDITGSVEDADNLDAAVGGAVEDEMLLEAFDGPSANTLDRDVFTTSADFRHFQKPTE